MNILHIKYAVEVAKVGSINKASENLGMAQPNISRAIKDLEADFGITIFDRSAKGMTLTPEGRDFISASQKILDQMNELERLYKGDHPGREKLTVSLPRGSYITEAIIAFSRRMGKESFEIMFRDASSEMAVMSVIGSESNIGMVRYTKEFEKLFEGVFEEKHLDASVISEFEKTVILSAESELSDKEEISREDLHGMTEITDADAAERLHAFESLRDELHDHEERCIHESDSLTQLELISANVDFFMIAPPMSEKTLARFGLIQKRFVGGRMYKDVLIHRKDHKLSTIEKAFIEELKLNI